MNDDQVGPAIKKCFEYLSYICRDSGQMLRVVEDWMKRKRLEALWGSATIWARSYASYGAENWLPNYLCRVYVTKGRKGQKVRAREERFLFLNVYFMPERLNQPVVVYGAVKIRMDDFRASWDELMIQNFGPSFLVSEQTEEFEEYRPGEESSIEFVFYKVLPLVELADQKHVEWVCSEAYEAFGEIGERSKG